MVSKEQANSSDKSRVGKQAVRPAAREGATQDQAMVPAKAIQKARLVPRSLTPQDVLQLQRTVGNHAVGRLLADTTEGAAVQREVDKSSSPFLPTYEEDEVPGWQDDGGVAEWAKAEYRRESKRTVICSMTPDRKIGSVYFGEEGRIRTTHGAGPAQEKHETLTTVQFNINESLATSEFEKAYPKLVNSEHYWNYFDQWLVLTLKNVTVDNAPEWATLVDSPDTAYDLNTGSPPEEIKLFEIFKNINGKVERWHPSRGTATKLDTDKQTIAVLHAAITHIDGKGLQDPKERNKEFYKFVKSRLPKFVDYMRHPDEVN